MNKHKGTTIAFRDGILAADSQVTLGSTVVSQSCEKIIKGNNALIGGTGDLSSVFAFRRWAAKIDWSKQKDPPDYEMPEGASGIVIVRGKVTPYNIISYDDGGWFIDPYSSFYSWGSGSDIALGALHHGATAYEAVEIAARCSLGTGGPIMAIELDPPTIKPKRTRKPKNEPQCAPGVASDNA